MLERYRQPSSTSHRRYMYAAADLHELSRAELRLTNLVNTDMVDGNLNAAAVELKPKPAQLRFASGAVATGTYPELAKSIKSAEALEPMGGRSSQVLHSPIQWLSERSCF